MIYLTVNGEEQGTQIATTKGWGDFSRWVDGLPEADNQQLLHLITHGWSQKPKEPQEQVQQALNDSSPESADVRTVAEGLVQFLDELDTEDAVAVTNGLGE